MKWASRRASGDPSHFPIRIATILVLAGAVSAQTDSVKDSASGSRTANDTVPVRWLPLKVGRYSPADLEASGSVAAAGNGAVAAAADTGAKLKIGGSKSIQVGVGNNGGVALDQKLYLTANGELSPGVKLDARLSDGDVPLSSQGSSASLREIDQLYLAVESEHWNLRLGDQDWTLAPDLAPGADRRLRGVSAGWRNRNLQATGTIGGPQAKWKRIQFAGVEGKQEGYVLAAWQGGLHGAIVPGSETVRINGQLVKRGSDADYLVCYADGLLDFTTHRRIASSDLVEVEFQAADLDYERSFAAGRTAGTAGPWRWEGWAVREGDDATHPLAYVPDSTTRRLLAQAGSDSLAARTADGQILALPNQTGEAGIRLRWGDTAFWIGTDLRGSDHDANVVSSVDERIGGIFGTGAMGLRAGDYVSRGGPGRFEATLRGQSLDARFRGISRTDSLGSGNDGLWAPRQGGGRTSAEGALGWDLLPGVGWKGEAGGRLDDAGWTERTKSTVGVDRGDDRQILTSQEWMRLDDGVLPREQTRTKSRLAWQIRNVVPSVELATETLDRRLDTGATGSAPVRGNAASLESRAGAVWRPSVPGLEIGVQGMARRDAVRMTASQARDDTARSVGTGSRLRWSPATGDLDLELDWKRTRTRPTASLPWVASESWLGSASGGLWPVPGVRGQGAWKLSSSSYQPEIPRYDTVPVGTGTYRYDTLLRVVVPSDLGDLRLAGTRLDTSRPAVLASQRSLSVEGEFEPGKVVAGLEGVLADIGLKGHAEWEETDSTAADRIWPHFLDDDLAQAITGRSDFLAGGWWGRERKRMDFEWTRTLTVQSSPTVARLRDMEERLQWSSSTEKGHRLDIEGRHGDLRDLQPDRLRLESYWLLDPSIGIRVVPSVELRPGWHSKWARGSEKSATFWAELQEPYASLRADLPRDLKLVGEVRRVSARADDLAGSRLTEGYPDGATWRMSSSLDWAWKDHLQARAEWVGRKEPGRPWFQKLSAEAKATF